MATFCGVPVVPRPIAGPGVGVGMPIPGRRNAHGCSIPIIEAIRSRHAHTVEWRPARSADPMPYSSWTALMRAPMGGAMNAELGDALLLGLPGGCPLPRLGEHGHGGLQLPVSEQPEHAAHHKEAAPSSGYPDGTRRE